MTEWALRKLTGKSNFFRDIALFEVKRVKQIQTGLSLLVLVALLGAWSGQIAHLILVPHHYCFTHDEISHEDEHHNDIAGWLATEVAADEHCSILASYLRSGTLTSKATFTESAVARNDVRLELHSVSLFLTDLFLLAPKNSPPHGV